MENNLYYSTGALHRDEGISSNFDSELKTLETTFLNAGYPKRFISHAVKSFLEDSSEDDNLIPSFLFGECKQIFIKLPYCNRNERLSKTFISKLKKFTGLKYIFFVLWQTRQIKSLFILKDKKHSQIACYLQRGLFLW